MYDKYGFFFFHFTQTRKEVIQGIKIHAHLRKLYTNC